ncbi:MAG: TetR/AcrR family transcriptional regulator [Cyclobacteriaceae bacterium]|nr:TetR/AcrR family transcriptional regulator [Cyclobacteriaceae bacterium]
MPATKNNKSHQAILLAAKNLFWKYGIKRVTVEEICKEAAVSKMTFYRLFANKTEVANAVLDLVITNNMEKYRNIMQQEIPFPQKIHQVVQLKYEGTLEMSDEFFSEVYQSDDLKLKDTLLAFQRKGLEAFLADCKKAQQEGWIKNDLKPEFILYILNKINEMLLDEKLLSMYRNTQEAIMALTNFFFYGITLPKD